MGAQDEVSQARGALPRISLCVPGPWDAERDLERLRVAVGNPGLELAAAPRDPELVERFRDGNRPGPRALAPSDLDAIGKHQAAVYVMSPPLDRPTAGAVAHAMLRAAGALLAQGGLGLLWDGSARALTRAGGKALLAATDAGLARMDGLRKGGKATPEQQREAKLAFWAPLVDAYVSTRNADAGAFYTSGLQLLGQPDGEVARTDVGDDPDRAASLLQLLALHLAAESNGRVRASDVLRDAQGVEFSLARAPGDRFAPQSFQWNTWGCVRLARHAGAAVGSPVEGALAPDAARRVHRVLAFLAGADGKIAATEQAVLEAYRARLGIPDAEAAGIEREGAQGKGVVLGKGAEERELLQQALLEVVTADGELQDGEVRRLRKVVASLGLAPRELIPPLRALLG